MKCSVSTEVTKKTEAGFGSPSFFSRHRRSVPQPTIGTRSAAKRAPHACDHDSHLHRDAGVRRGGAGRKAASDRHAADGRPAADERDGVDMASACGSPSADLAGPTA